MVAYSFNKQFEDAIARGYRAFMRGAGWDSEMKSHTIRKDGRRRHSRPGEAIQLYTGMRTKACRKLVDPDPVCLYCSPIVIDSIDGELSIKVAGRPIADVDQFAMADGFQSAHTMHLFWCKFHPAFEEEGFVGSLIGWGSPREWGLWSVLYKGGSLDSSFARHAHWVNSGVLVKRDGLIVAAA